MNVDGIRRLVLEGRLMSEGEIDQQIAAWKDQQGNSDDGNGLISRLVETDVITDFQARALKAGIAGPYKFGPYLVKDRLVAGALGNVFRAVHEEFNQPVGLKIFSSKLKDDPELATRLARETRVAVQVDHANVVRTFQVGKVGDVIFLAIEDLQGETLAARLRRDGTLSFKEVLKLGRELGLALSHLHSLEIIHRDVQPANIWLTSDGHAKLMEFGAARDALSELDEEEDIAEILSRNILGHYDYLSAEQGLDEKSADARSDVYALGCVLFRCLTGEVVFPDNNPVRKMLRHALEPAANVCDFNADIPREIADVVGTMLQKDPDQRYQKAQDVAWALEQLITEEEDLEAATADIDPGFLEWARSVNEFADQSAAQAAVADTGLLDFLDWMAVNEPEEEKV